MEIKMCTGSEVLAMLGDADFMQRWQSLYGLCPWATGYQSPPYVSAWYRHYYASCKPLLLWAESDGVLLGLLTLTLAKRGDLIVGAGAHQAAYQVWLATPESSAAFIGAALAALHAAYPRRHLHLKHLAPGTPLEGLRDASAALRCSLSAPEPRPYMRTDAERIVKSFNGKTNRNLYNRLKRLGEVQFRVVTDVDELNAALDEYIRQYDFRQAAMYDCAPFRVDPSKKAFYRRLLADGMLHVSLLQVGDAVVSVNVGLRGPDSVQVGITHSPLYADYSPGRLHTYMLCMELAKEGCRNFDLTPGGGYKSQLATDTDEVVELSALSTLHTLRLQRRARLAKLASAWLGRLGVTTTAARLALARAKKSARMALSGALPLTAGKYCIYRGVPQAATGPWSMPALRANQIDDLLHYDEAGGRKTYHEFQYDAMKRLESRQHVYTIVHDDKLVFCAWIGKRAELALPGADEKMPAESDGVIALYDIYRHARASLDDRLRGYLEQILSDLPGRLGLEAASVDLVLHAHDKAARSVAEQAGFRLLAQS